MTTANYQTIHTDCWIIVVCSLDCSVRGLLLAKNSCSHKEEGIEQWQNTVWNISSTWIIRSHNKREGCAGYGVPTTSLGGQDVSESNNTSEVLPQKRIHTILYLRVLTYYASKRLKGRSTQTERYRMFGVAGSDYQPSSNRSVKLISQIDQSNRSVKLISQSKTYWFSLDWLLRLINALWDLQMRRTSRCP
jgi:hypothetical protein